MENDRSNGQEAAPLDKPMACLFVFVRVFVRVCVITARKRFDFVAQRWKIWCNALHAPIDTPIVLVQAWPLDAYLSRLMICCRHVWLVWAIVGPCRAIGNREQVREILCRKFGRSSSVSSNDLAALMRHRSFNRKVWYQRQAQYGPPQEGHSKQALLPLECLPTDDALAG